MELCDAYHEHYWYYDITEIAKDMRLENDGTWTFILSDSEKDAVFIITHHNHLAFRYKNKMHIIRSYRSSMYTTSSGAYRILIVPI